MDGSMFRGLFEGLILFGVIIGVTAVLIIGGAIYFGHSWFSTHKITVEKKPIASLVVTNTVTNIIYLPSTNK
jgi:hypothetical protein